MPENDNVYAIVNETDITGLWTDPEEAVKHAFSYELTAEGGICLGEEQLLTAREAAKKMSEPNCDYPYLAKIKFNPTNDNEVWRLDR